MPMIAACPIFVVTVHSHFAKGWLVNRAIVPGAQGPRLPLVNIKELLGAQLPWISRFWRYFFNSFTLVMIFKLILTFTSND